MKRLTQRGDTILEVLIAVAVLSLILTTTYALANRSTQANRQAAERSEAAKIVQSEMEKLKLYVSIPGAALPPEGTYFCMKSDGKGYVPLNGTRPTPDKNADPSFSSGIYNPGGNLCRAGVNDLYYKLMYRGTAADGTANTYTSYVRWPAITGNGVDEASMVHRLYPDLTSVILASAPRCIINNNIAVSLDRSGSMSDEFTPGINRITAATGLLNDFFREADLRANGNRASFSVWSGEYIPGVTLQPVTLQETTDNYGLLRNSLNGIVLDGDNRPAGTNLKYGLDIGYAELERARVTDPAATRVLVLLTDGDQANTDVITGVKVERPEVVARANQIKREGVLIYVIGIYNQIQANDGGLTNFLRDISSGPAYNTAAINSAQVEAMLDSINTTLDC